jgi:hypothetical protein
VINKQIRIDRIRMIEIRLMALIKRHIGKISIIRILLDQNYFPGADSLDDLPCDRRFP